MEALKGYTIKWERELVEICAEIGKEVSERKDKMSAETFDAYVDVVGKVSSARFMLRKINKGFEASRV
jgi:hypothetical protein